MGNRKQACRVWYRLLAFHIITEQHTLVADVKLAIDYNRMRPAVLVAAVSLIKPPLFGVALRICINQGHGPISRLAADIEMSVGIGDRALADTFVRPGNPARLEIHAGPGLGSIRKAIDITIEQDNPAMMIHHVLVGINLFRLEAFFTL